MPIFLQTVRVNEERVAGALNIDGVRNTHLDAIGQYLPHEIGWLPNRALHLGTGQSLWDDV